MSLTIAFLRRERLPFSVFTMLDFTLLSLHTLGVDAAVFFTLLKTFNPKKNLMRIDPEIECFSNKANIRRNVACDVA